MVQVQSQPIPSAGTPAPFLPGTSGNFFGRVAVLNGLITQSQLEECLRIQERLRGMGLTKRLGEILIEKKFITDEQVHDLLELQHHRAITGNTTVVQAPLTESVGPRLGDLLLENHLISKSLLNECLGLQKQLRGMGVQMKLGDILHQRGHLKPEVVACVLRLQRARKGRSTLRRNLIVIGTLCAASLLVAAVSIGRSVWTGDPQGPAPTRRAPTVARSKPATTPASGGGVQVGSSPATGSPTTANPSVTTDESVTAPERRPPTEQELVAQRLVEELRIRKLERELFPEDHAGDGGSDPEPAPPGK